MPYFDEQKADVAANFFEVLLKHTADEWYGKPFLLAPWEEEALRYLFGWYNDDGSWLVNTGYLEVPKKQGKTEWAAGLILMALVLAEHPGFQVYGAAASQKQAQNVYRAACKMVEQQPELSRRLRLLRSTHRIISRKDPDSFYAAIAADGNLSDGVNPGFVVADELHRWHTRAQLENWDVLSLGGITRKQSMCIGITTAGVQSESPLAWRYHEKALKQREGVIDDPAFFGRVYGAEDGDDWTDEKTWVKANPSLKENGGFLDIAKIREKYTSALSDPDGQRSFRRYHLNLWDEKANRAIDMAKWNACVGEGDWIARGLQPKAEEDIVRPLHADVTRHFVDRECWAGVDLSLSTDMSAVVFVFPGDDDTIDLLPFYWMPAATIRKRELQDGMPYRAWADAGFLELCGGELIDYREIRARLEWGRQMFGLQEICWDPWNSREISASMIDDGFKCLEVRQRYTELSEPTKKLLQLVTVGKLKHGNHPVLAWNASCLSTKADGNDLIRPVKPDREKDKARIDGLAATINALARIIVAQPQDHSCPVVVI